MYICLGVTNKLDCVIDLIVLVSLLMLRYRMGIFWCMLKYNVPSIPLGMPAMPANCVGRQ